MSLSKEIAEESEFAKTQLMNSDLDDRCKRSLFRLINCSMMATNDISTEEKIRKITEAIHGLVLSQITFIDTINKKIQQENREQCKTCEAMRYVHGVKNEEQKQQIIDEWLAKTGQKKPDEEPEEKKSWSDTIKHVLCRPGVWIFLTLVMISPYGVDILKVILEFFGNK